MVSWTVCTVLWIQGKHPFVEYGKTGLESFGNRLFRHYLLSLQRPYCPEKEGGKKIITPAYRLTYIQARKIHVKKNNIQAHIQSTSPLIINQKLYITCEGTLFNTSLGDGVSGATGDSTSSTIAAAVGDSKDGTVVSLTVEIIKFNLDNKFQS